MSLIKRILWYFKPLKTTVANISITAPSRKLAGKRVIVTGGTRGLGYYIAKRFAAEGGEVLITGRDETKTAIVAKEIGCKYLCLDVTHLESFKGFFSIARKELGGQIDILVNNAGISLHEGNMMNVTVEGFSSQIMTNLTGPYFLAQEFLRQYENQIEKSNASIIFMASEKGLFPDELPYGLTKAAIVSLTQGMARRWVTKGIRVNALAPGVTASDMTGYKRDNLYCENNCSRRAYLPEEVAEVAVFLASDTSRCITGRYLPRIWEIICGVTGNTEMNILFVLQRYPGFGGIESVTRMLAGEFIGRFGYRVAVFSTSRQDNSSQLLDGDLFYYQTSDLKGDELKKEFDALVHDFSPNFIIYQDSYVPEDFLLEHLPQGIKIIVCEHNTPDCLETGLESVTKNLSWANPMNIIRKLRLPRRMRNLHKATTEHHKKMLHVADRYLILSDGFRPILRDFFHIESPQISTMPNPIEVPREPIIIESRPNQALYVGRLTDQKGIKYLIEIWSKIEPHCNWKLLVVGDGDKRQYMEKEIRSRRLKNIRLIGFQQHTSGYFMESSAHLMTSIYEGFGITNLEAAIRGTIPFAFNSFASAKDIIDDGQTGYLIKPFDVDAYVETFLAFTKLPQSKMIAMRRKAIERAQEFSLQHIADKWNELFNKLRHGENRDTHLPQGL